MVRSAFVPLGVLTLATLGALAVACVGDDPETSPSPATDAGPDGSGGDSGFLDDGGGGSDASGAKHWLVAVGGNKGNPNGPTPLEATFVAPINGDGTLGDWKSGTSLPTPRAKAASVAVGRSLFLMGGTTDDQAGGNPTDDVLFTNVADDGTLSPWTTTAKLPAVTAQHFAATDGTSIFAAGAATLYSAKTNLAGVGGWNSIASDAVGSLSIAFARGSLIVVGGSGTVDGGSTIRRVRRAPVTDGVVGAWLEETPLPEDRDGHASVVVGDYLYTFGGFATNGSGGVLDSVLFTKLAADGKPSTWSALTPMPEGRALACAAAVAGHVYVIGGYPGQGLDWAYKTVFVGKVNTDGSIDWKKTTELPADGRSQLGCAAF